MPRPFCETQSCCRSGFLHQISIPCRSGGIGRRAWFRSTYSQGCGGSSPFFGTKAANQHVQADRASPLFFWVRWLCGGFFGYISTPNQEKISEQVLSKAERAITLVRATDGVSRELWRPPPRGHAVNDGGMSDSEVPRVVFGSEPSVKTRCAPRARSS